MVRSVKQVQYHSVLSKRFILTVLLNVYSLRLVAVKAGHLIINMNGSEVGDGIGDLDHLVLQEVGQVIVGDVDGIGEAVAGTGTVTRMAATDA